MPLAIHLIELPHHNRIADDQALLCSEQSLTSSEEVPSDCESLVDRNIRRTS